jgi:hypothetical protein
VRHSGGDHDFSKLYDGDIFDVSPKPIAFLLRRAEH